MSELVVALGKLGINALSAGSVISAIWTIVLPMYSAYTIKNDLEQRQLAVKQGFNKLYKYIYGIDFYAAEEEASTWDFSFLTGTRPRIMTTKELFSSYDPDSPKLWDAYFIPSEFNSRYFGLKESQLWTYLQSDLHNIHIPLTTTVHGFQERILTILEILDRRRTVLVRGNKHPLAAQYYEEMLNEFMQALRTPHMKSVAVLIARLKARLRNNIDTDKGTMHVVDDIIEEMEKQEPRILNYGVDDRTYRLSMEALLLMWWCRGYVFKSYALVRRLLRFRLHEMDYIPNLKQQISKLGEPTKLNANYEKLYASIQEFKTWLEPHTREPKDILEHLEALHDKLLEYWENHRGVVLSKDRYVQEPGMPNTDLVKKLVEKRKAVFEALGNKNAPAIPTPNVNELKFFFFYVERALIQLGASWNRQGQFKYQVYSPGWLDWENFQFLRSLDDNDFRKRFEDTLASHEEKEQKVLSSRCALALDPSVLKSMRSLEKRFS